MTSGLDMMKAARDKKKGSRVGNEMPPPLHPARSTPVKLPWAPEAAAEVEDSPTPAPEAVGAAPAADSPVPAAPAGPARTAAAPVRRQQQKRPAADRAVSSELIPTTAYLEMDEDRFIRRTIEAGRYGKPKVTSASAVIRYAVQYLARHMTPEEVVAAIREAAPETSNQGRIRL
ncbi:MULTISPECIES: hypothetical protein [Mycobacterium]|nr:MULTISPECIES: hypothetical protein [Mycobacterium]MBX9978042.1 hypothetical protein [Mycobacterium gordonae]UCA22975.1 hypothetical protein LA359_29295 [Mycobacterium kansasii]